MLKLADYFFVLRPILFFPAWTVILIGFLKNTGADLVWPVPCIYWDAGLALVCLSTAMLMGSGLIVNQLQDTQTDRLNKKLFLISEGLVSRRIVVGESVLLCVAAFFISYLVSPLLTVLFLASLMFFIIGYNYRPFHLKDRPWGSLVANGLMGVFVFAFGWILQPLSVFDLIRDASPYFFYNTGLYLLTTIPDIEGDRNAGKNTLAVRYGIPFTVSLAALLHGISVITAFLLGDRILLLPAIILSGLYSVLIIRKNSAMVLRTIKLGLFLLALMAGIFFPLYFAVIVLFFILTRWYYKKRFGIVYPSFKGA